ncbi:hypothetical protein HMPREF3156_01945 [Neisseria sp. HMSC06F02]|nr:hypothetical protein HMPREF3156_01945 [Neisseria sp. HMSC06F02]
MPIKGRLKTSVVSFQTTFVSIFGVVKQLYANLPTKPTFRHLFHETFLQ